jgi:hypothetical protein
VNEQEKLVMFTAWSQYNKVENGVSRYLIFHDQWKYESDSKLGYNDALEKLDLVENYGYELCIAIADATVRFAMPLANRMKRSRSSDSGQGSFFAAAWKEKMRCVGPM